MSQPNAALPDRLTAEREAEIRKADESYGHRADLDLQLLAESISCPAIEHRRLLLSELDAVRAESGARLQQCEELAVAWTRVAAELDALRAEREREALGLTDEDLAWLREQEARERRCAHANVYGARDAHLASADCYARIRATIATLTRERAGATAPVVTDAMIGRAARAMWDVQHHASFVFESASGRERDHYLTLATRALTAALEGP